MKVRISQATIIDSRHPDNGQCKDLLLSDGIIEKIADRITEKAELELSGEGLCVSIGWMDMRANFRDPGFEWKEDLDSGLQAAANGGFTAVALSPNTEPKIDSKSMVNYTLQKSLSHPVQIVPVGCLSKKMEGQNLAELYDMFQAGAKAFGDDKSSLTESGLLQRALLYTKSFGATIMHFPLDSSLIPNGQINEGPLSTSLGLKGIPSVAEEMVVRRDLTILEYTEGKLHLGPISSHKSVDLISDAKNAGLEVSCETTAAHLANDEGVLENFDSFYKIQPPLRNDANRQKLMEQLVNGHIDIISSDHAPEDEENKKLEFEHAHFGQAGIETFFPTLWDACEGKIGLAKLVATFSINPRKVMGMELPEIKEGSQANLTLFYPNKNSQVQIGNLKTKAYNTYPEGKQLKGKVLGVFANGVYIPATL